MKNVHRRGKKTNSEPTSTKKTGMRHRRDRKVTQKRQNRDTEKTKQRHRKDKTETPEKKRWK